MRVQNWQGLLTAYLGEAARKEFSEGEHDCALFAAGAVRVVTGQDHAAAYRGRYGSTLEGLRELRKDGFADHVALVASIFKEKPVARAFPGDLAVVETQQGPALGVVQGEGIFVLQPKGLALVPLVAAIKVFEV